MLFKEQNMIIKVVVFIFQGDCCTYLCFVFHFMHYLCLYEYVKIYNKYYS